MSKNKIYSVQHMQIASELFEDFFVNDYVSKLNCYGKKKNFPEFWVRDQVQNVVLNSKQFAHLNVQLNLNLNLNLNSNSNSNVNTKQKFENSIAHYFIQMCLKKNLDCCSNIRTKCTLCAFYTCEYCDSEYPI